MSISNLTYFVTFWRHQWRHECVKHNLHNYTSPTMYLQNIVCVAPVLHSKIVRTNIVTNIDTHTHTNKHTNKHTGWKHYHLAIAGDNKSESFTIWMTVHVAKLLNLQRSLLVLYTVFNHSKRDLKRTNGVGCRVPWNPRFAITTHKMHRKHANER